MTDGVLTGRNLVVGYGGRPILNGINIALRENEVLCLLGHNGAGKSTLIKALFGLIRPQSGTVTIGGTVSMVPEGRGIFPNLLVREIMDLFMWAAAIPKAEREDRITWVLGILPPIKEFLYRRAGTLSGGQQQMVSIARALLNRPRILLLDEPSIGLAPKLFQDLLQPIRKAQQREKMSILLVEQNVREALRISDRVIVMKSGSLIWEGLPADLDSHKKLIELY